ncbi:MAG: mechanosensitive ion channel family protein [Saprospiraceae bacterium]|nr:mechanosensitive ion channel family protein [Saprospiraceae bacterium]
MTYNVVVFLIIIVLTLIVGLIANKLLTKIVRKSTEVMTKDPTNYKFLKHIVLACIYLVGFGIAIYAMPNFRALAGSMLAGAGIFAVAIGFAAQHALSNVVSGVFIVIFKPFRINDRLNIQSHQGVVEDITLRHTVIRNFENRRIIIPNSVISNEIIVNADFADDKIVKWIDISISYDSDIDIAKNIMREEVLAHPLRLDPRTPEDIEAGVPEVIVRVLSLMDSSVNLRAWAWGKDSVDAFILSCDLLESIKKRFDNDPRVEIPFPHRTVYVKSGELNKIV